MFVVIDTIINDQLGNIIVCVTVVIVLIAIVVVGILDPECQRYTCSAPHIVSRIYAA